MIRLLVYFIEMKTFYGVFLLPMLVTVVMSCPCYIGSRLIECEVEIQPKQLSRCIRRLKLLELERIQKLSVGNINPLELLLVIRRMPHLQKIHVKQDSPDCTCEWLLFNEYVSRKKLHFTGTELPVCTKARKVCRELPSVVDNRRISRNKRSMDRENMKSTRTPHIKQKKHKNKTVVGSKTKSAQQEEKILLKQAKRKNVKKRIKMTKNNSTNRKDRPKFFSTKSNAMPATVTTIKMITRKRHDLPNFKPKIFSTKSYKVPATLKPVKMTTRKLHDLPNFRPKIFPTRSDTVPATVTTVKMTTKELHDMPNFAKTNILNQYRKPQALPTEITNRDREFKTMSTQYLETKTRLNTMPATVTAVKMTTSELHDLPNFAQTELSNQYQNTQGLPTKITYSDRESSTVSKTYQETKKNTRMTTPTSNTLFQPVKIVTPVPKSREYTSNAINIAQLVAPKIIKGSVVVFPDGRQYEMKTPEAEKNILLYDFNIKTNIKQQIENRSKRRFYMRVFIHRMVVFLNKYTALSPSPSTYLSGLLLSGYRNAMDKRISYISEETSTTDSPPYVTTLSSMQLNIDKSSKKGISVKGYSTKPLVNKPGIMSNENITALLEQDVFPTTVNWHNDSITQTAARVITSEETTAWQQVWHMPGKWFDTEVGNIIATVIFIVVLCVMFLVVRAILVYRSGGCRSKLCRPCSCTSCKEYCCKAEEEEELTLLNSETLQKTSSRSFTSDAQSTSSAGSLNTNYVYETYRPTYPATPTKNILKDVPDEQKDSYFPTSSDSSDHSVLNTVENREISSPRADGGQQVSNSPEIQRKTPIIKQYERRISYSAAPPKPGETTKTQTRKISYSARSTEPTSPLHDWLSHQRVKSIGGAFMSSDEESSSTD